ncbi:hypothetical protein AVEN_268314-1 [Araneus ventricosus]|uniref:Uncharacterized protein n=1 Tax=Araneus ventricosus TaxID=182803 RepID=A0A4Y2WXC3_ARAVE|nr:hypothetical protein AVEN_268314-1 [Araneus ventricosus]
MKSFLSLQKFQQDDTQGWAINCQQRKEPLFSRKIHSGVRNRLSSTSVEWGGLRRDRAHTGNDTKGKQVPEKPSQTFRQILSQMSILGCSYRPPEAQTEENARAAVVTFVVLSDVGCSLVCSHNLQMSLSDVVQGSQSWECIVFKWQIFDVITSKSVKPHRGSSQS